MNTNENELAKKHVGAALVRIILDVKKSEDRLICLRGKKFTVYSTESGMVSGEGNEEDDVYLLNGGQPSMIALFEYDEGNALWYLSKAAGLVYLNGCEVLHQSKGMVKLTNGSIASLGGAPGDDSTMTFLFVADLAVYLEANPLALADQSKIVRGLKEVSSELICNICHGQVVSPVILFCGHYVCLHCYTLLSEAACGARPKCPICRETVTCEIPCVPKLYRVIDILMKISLDREQTGEWKEAWKEFRKHGYSKTQGLHSRVRMSSRSEIDNAEDEAYISGLNIHDHFFLAQLGTASPSDGDIMWSMENILANLAQPEELNIEPSPDTQSLLQRISDLRMNPFARGEPDDALGDPTSSFRRSFNVSTDDDIDYGFGPIPSFIPSYSFGGLNQIDEEDEDDW